MAAEGGNNIIWFTYTGADGEVIPRDATHVFVDVTTIPENAFWDHPNIVEVICHDRVEKIGSGAFFKCPCLWRVIMPGVKIAERGAFNHCLALTHVGCGKLEIIERSAFYNCASLRSINLPSAEIVGNAAFHECIALTDVKFSSKLERIEEVSFKNCRSLERITIPLKDGMITADGIFTGCESLNHVNLVEGEELHETIAALHFEEWRNDMWEEITSIHHILPNTNAGGWDNRHVGEKAQEIRRWIRSVLGRILHYQAEHQRVLDVAVTTLVLALPYDIVMKNVLSFLELPSYTFE